MASIAAEHDLPFACIPAGTRNHFALDLGVDRDDVVGALDAFVSGGERRVDLAEVNGRTFVNNVSLGLYAEAVQREGYREAKLRTILDTVPDMMGTDGAQARRLGWIGPDGARHDHAAVILVSNNIYRLGRVLGSGTRPHIDDGLLGISVMEPPQGRAGAAGTLAPVVGAHLRGDRRRAAAGGRQRRGPHPRDADPLRHPGGSRCACASLPSTPARHPRRRSPTGMVNGLRMLAAIARGGSPRPRGPH